MENSTFSVNTYCSDYTSTVSSQHRLAHSIKLGAVPIVFWLRFEYPFSEILDWSKAVIQVPMNSISNIQVILHQQNKIFNRIKPQVKK